MKTPKKLNINMIYHFHALRLLLNQDEDYYLPLNCKLELAVFTLALKMVG